MSITGGFIVPHPPVIIPEIGKGREAEIQKTMAAYQKCAMQIARLKPSTIILTSPHSAMYLDYFHISPGSHAKGDFSEYRAKNVAITVEYDEEVADCLVKHAARQGIPAGFVGEKSPELDHGTMIPLYFINQLYKDYKLVRIGLSGLSLQMHYRFGMCIAETVQTLERNTVFIASGDLSHKLLPNGSNGYAQEGETFDKLVTEAMEYGDFLRFLQFEDPFLEKAAECGLRSFVIMAGALDRKEVKSELLSYEGPFGVGYGVASFLPYRYSAERAILDKSVEAELLRLEKSMETESHHVRLARYSLEYYIKNRQLPRLPEGLPKNFYTERSGVFISIKKESNLRGCIGTSLPSRVNIAEEIMVNAVRAGTKDPRFSPIRADELSYLEYSVDVLSKPEPVESEAALDVKKYGIIVTHGRKKGVLLPDLPGVDTVKDQIRIARQKAGISEGEPVSLSRFEVVRYQ